MIGPRTFLAYKNYRHLKLSLAALAVAIGVYAWHDPVGGPNGGTWVGYAFGGIATLMILWLMWFGVRKRSYHNSSTPLQAWLSAHVYLGAGLLLLVPLHSGFQFGWNVHTLAYALMSAVIVSGMVGIAFYTSVPTNMTRNRPGQKLDGLIEQVADIDADCKVSASGLPNEVAASIAMAIDETRIGGSVFRQLRVDDPNCGTTRAIHDIREASKTLDLDLRGREDMRRVLELLALKQALLRRIRRDLRYKALLDLWLVVHVPLSFATVAAVGVHIFVVFYYW